MSLNMKLSEQLFLIEILVHKVHLRKDVYCQKDCRCPKSRFPALGEPPAAQALDQEDDDKIDYLPLRVRVKFINFPCVEINQKEFAGSEAAEPKSMEEKEKRKKDPGHFGTGKSFLFPMSPYDLIRGLNHYPLAVAVTFSENEAEPCRISVLGVTQVSLALEEVCNTVRRVNECEQILPISSTVKDAYDLVNLEGEYVGYIVMLIRLSCFGQSIVTQFQLTEERSYLFRNTRPDEPFPCDKCDDHLQYDPATYDLLPAAPFTSTDADLMELPCCEAARAGVFMERKFIQWRKIDCDCEQQPMEMDSGFLSRLSETYAEVISNKLPCSCCGRNPLSRPDPRIPLLEEMPPPPLEEACPPLTWDKMMPLGGPPGTVAPKPTKTAAPVGTVLPLGTIPVGDATPCGLSPRAAAAAKIGYVRTPGYTASEYMTPVGSVVPKLQPAPGSVAPPSPQCIPAKGQGLPVGYVPFNPDSMPKAAPSQPQPPAPYEGQMLGAWTGVTSNPHSKCNHPPCWEVMRLVGGASEKTGGDRPSSSSKNASKSKTDVTKTGSEGRRSNRKSGRSSQDKGAKQPEEKGKDAEGGRRPGTPEGGGGEVGGGGGGGSPTGRKRSLSQGEKGKRKGSTSEAQSRQSSARRSRAASSKSTEGEGGEGRQSPQGQGDSAAEEKPPRKKGEAGPVAGPGIISDETSLFDKKKKKKEDELGPEWQPERTYSKRKPARPEKDDAYLMDAEVQKRAPKIIDDSELVPDPPRRSSHGMPSSAETRTSHGGTQGGRGGVGSHDPWAPGGPWGPDGPWGARGSRGKRAVNPPVRYDTTGRLSSAYERDYEKEKAGKLLRPRSVKGTMGRRPKRDMPPVRYDTTSRISGAYKMKSSKKLPTNISKAVAAIRRGRKTTLQELQTMLGRLKHMDPPILVTAFRPSYKYSYVFGSRYPGTLFGHRDCAPRSRRVPGLKGWAWDTRAPLQRSTKLTPLPDGTLPEGTWRPGAICNSLRDRVKAPKRAMRPFGQAMRPRRLSNEHLPLNEEGKSGKTDNDDDNYDPKPTLHIHRYQGDFFVSMHPDDMAGENVPLQFRIINKEKKPITCQDSDSELEIELFQPGAFYTVPKPDLCDEKTQCEEQYLVENYVPPPKIITATEIPKPIDANGKAKGKGKEKKAKKGKKGKKKK